MFVNPEAAQEAFQLLKILVDSLGEKKALSQLDSKIYEAVNDIRILLAPKPYAPFNDIKEAVGNYVQYRDMLGIERKSWEDHERDVKEEMTRISMWLRDKGDEMGVDSFNTPYGTAYRNIKKSFRIEDWQAYSEWMRETDNLQCVEKRAAKLAVQDVIDETGSIPPGLTEWIEVEFNVRRPSKSRSDA